MNTNSNNPPEVIIIGGGQSGLAMGYHLKKAGIPFLILDAQERTGDTWRQRWDSLRLFTPAMVDCLPGMPYPAPSDYFPTKDEMADYLEQYANHFQLPITHGVRVDSLTREGSGFLISAGADRWRAKQVVVAMSGYQIPKTPSFAENLDPSIRQIHSFYYRHPGQLQTGSTLIVGAGNSGAEIAMELSRRANVSPIWVAGRDTGHIPFRIHGFFGRWLGIRLTLRFVFHRILSISTPMGRRMRPYILQHGGPLIRTWSKDLLAKGVRRVARVKTVVDGRPVLEDGQVLDVKNVIWCTGFGRSIPWIDIPIYNNLEPRHRRGIVDEVPGLYFIGLPFLYSLSSGMIHGVGRDAAYIAKAIARRRVQLEKQVGTVPMESYAESVA